MCFCRGERGWWSWVFDCLFVCLFDIGWEGREVDCLFFGFESG